MVNIPKSYKYRYNGVIHTGAAVPAGAELLETTDTLDTQTYNILSLIYPVGSIYIGVQEDCPLKTLISGSTWVKVSEGRVLQGSDSSHSAGTTIAAGLPNITGHYYENNPNAGGSASTSGISGALYNINFGQTVGKYSQPGGDTPCGIGFDASLSNSIYGNSNTVQPPAYVVNIWRRTA